MTKRLPAPFDVIAPLVDALDAGACLNFRPRVPRLTTTTPASPGAYVALAHTSTAEPLYILLSWIGEYRRALLRHDAQAAYRLVDDLGPELAGRIRLLVSGNDPSRRQT